MVLLSTLYRVSTYLSPARTDRDRTSSYSSTSSMLEQRLDRRSMSPATRTKTWLTRNTPSADSFSSRTPSILGVQGSSRITKRAHQARSTLSPLLEARYRNERYWDAPLFNKKAAAPAKDEEDDEDMEDLEDDADEDEEDEADEDENEDAEDDADDLANNTTLVAAEDEADDFANDTTLVADNADEEEDGADGEAPKISQAEQGELGLDVDMERERAERQAAAKAAGKGDWTAAEIELFERLSMRGFEPLLPGTWRMDFKTIPDPLFTDNDEEVFIGPTAGHDFRAIRALSSLLTLGVRVRDRLHTRHAPEEHTRREIESYIRWSERDAAVDRQPHIPVLAISTAATGQSTQDVINSVTAKLKHLAHRYRDQWRVQPSVEGSGQQGDKGKAKEKADENEKEKEKENEDEYEHELPTLYGIVIAHTIVSVVTLNAAEPDKPVRSIALFDLGDADADVWNAFAIAIVVVLARNYLVGLRQSDGQGVGPPAARSDPDA